MLLFNYCTFDDYLQIQALLKYEQRRREVAIHQHMQQQHQEALRKRRAQQYRLARAMHNLKVLKEIYRRERAYQIQRYMEHYRNQELIAAVEDAFYRQCLASAIEQRRADVIRQQYRQIEQEKDNGAFQQRQQQQEVTTQDDDEEDKGFEDYHANQLADLLRLLFNGQLEQQVKQKQESQQEPAPVQQEVQQQQPLNDASDQEEAHDLWNYITHLQDEQQDQNQPEQKEEKEPQLERMEQDEEEPTFIPKHEPMTMAPEPNQDNNDEDDFYDDDMINSDVNKVFQRQAVPQKTREPEAINVIDKNNCAGVPEQPYLGSWSNPHKIINNDVEEQQQEEPEETDPPLQDRVLNLKDLLDELVSDGSSADTTNTTMDNSFSPQQAAATSPEDDDNDSAMSNDDDDDAMNLFEPKQIVTDAEPTPQPEHAITATAADIDPIPPPIISQQQQHHHHHHHHHEQPDEDFVNKIAEQQRRNVPPADPAKYEELQQVNRQLDEIRDNRLATVLKTPLHFENKSGTLQVTATTPNNREFLGCEDEIMRNMLKLDTVQSNGDEGIRNERRALVKKAECMLEQMDEHKQIEWEMARRTSKQQQQHKKKKNRHHNKNRQYNNPHRSSQRNKAGGILVG